MPLLVCLGIFIFAIYVMTQAQIKQNAVYIGIAVIAFIFTYAIAPDHSLTPKGIILPTVKSALKPSTQPVQLFENKPDNATYVADINLEMHSTKPTGKQEQQMLEAAKALAQKAGANGLVIGPNTFGYEGAGLNNPEILAKYVLFAKAIKSN